MARPTDTLAITIRRVEDNAGGYYQVTLRRHPQAVLGGPFRQGEAIQPAAVYELQRSYETLLERLLALAEAQAPVPPIDLQKLFGLSRTVAGILPDSVQRSLQHAQLRAQDRHRELQITLQVDGASRQLLAVPWELIALPMTRGTLEEGVDDGFLLLNADVSLVRQVRGIGHNTPPRLTRPLKLVGIAATPYDAREIKLEPIREPILMSLDPAVRAGAWYEGPDTLHALQRLLREQNPQVLHILCHGDQTDTSRGVRSDLLFTHRDGYTQRVGAADLVPILTLANDLQLVVLQACHVGAGRVLQQDEIARLDRASRATESLSLALVRAGVPAVVAFQGPVRQAAAGEFTRACYEALANGATVEAAVAAGRIAARAAGGIVDWSQALIYQGSGWPEQPAWHTRLADGFMRALMESGPRRALRAAILALALVLLAAAAVRLALLPASPVPPPPALRTALLCWAGFGVAGPAIIAAASRGSEGRDDLPGQVYREVRNARFVGAYLGYALGGIVWLAAVLALWVIGPLLFVPLGLLPTITFAAILVSCFVSYGAARSQALGAAIIAPVTPGLYHGGTLLVTMIAALILLAAPLLIFALPAGLISPAGVGLGMALALLTAVLRG